MSDNEFEHQTMMARYFFFGLVVLTLGVVSVRYVWTWLEPGWVEYEHNTFVNSHQYVEARKTEVLNDIKSYDDLSVKVLEYGKNPKDNAEIIEGLKLQQTSLKNKINESLHKMPRNEWPDGSERFAK